MENSFFCVDCHETKPIAKEGGTGYATLADGSKVCYACVGLRDARELRETGKQVGYLSRYGNADGTSDWNYSNWPSSFSVKVDTTKSSVNNFGAERIDFWFTFEGARYWGVNIGDNQLARVRRVKSK